MVQPCADPNIRLGVVALASLREQWLTFPSQLRSSLLKLRVGLDNRPSTLKEGAKLLSEYTRPALYPKQLDAMFCAERYGLIEASTKSGKTVSAIAWIVEQALTGEDGNNYWWIAPGYNQAEIAYRRIKRGMTKDSFVAFDTPTPRLRLNNGAWIWFKSAEDANALYGEDVYASVIDEASRIKEDSWHAVRSTLTATRGPVRIIGNVKGRRNWFYTLARRAESLMLAEPDPLRRNMHYAKITADDAVAAGVLEADEIADARETLPEKIFRELYYAEPGDDTGNPFGLAHIAACSTPVPAAGPAVAYGIDLAKSQDWFVVIGINETGGVCEFHRWRSLPWRASIQRVWKIVGEDAPALVDSTGLGDPVLEELQFEHGNFTGYHFSPTSKQKLMEGLAVSIQGREITFPMGPIVSELETFEYEFTRFGVRYSAPPGHHDDCVAALALARQMWAEAAPGDNMIKYYADVAAKRLLREEEEVKTILPWKSDEELASEVLDNELSDLYNETVSKLSPSAAKRCRTCGDLVTGPTRISDGEFIWHPHCVAGQASHQRAA